MGLNPQFFHPFARANGEKDIFAIAAAAVVVPKPIRRAPKADLGAHGLIKFLVAGILTVVRHLANVTMQYTRPLVKRQNVLACRLAAVAEEERCLASKRHFENNRGIVAKVIRNALIGSKEHLKMRIAHIVSIPLEHPNQLVRKARKQAEKRPKVFTASRSTSPGMREKYCTDGKLQ